MLTGRAIGAVVVLVACWGCLRGGFERQGGAGDARADLASADQRPSGDQRLPGDLSGDLSGDAGPAGGKPAFVLFGVDGRRMVTFDQGETWAVDQADSVLTGDQERWLMGGAWSAKRVVLVGGPWNDPGGYLLHSLDGTSWTEVAITDGQGPLDVAYGGGRFVTVNNVGHTCVSTDGTSFTQCQSTSLESGRGVCHGQGKFFAAGDSGRISTSTDGVTWQSTMLGGATLNTVACGTDRFVAVSNDRRVTTLDGLTALKDESGVTMGCCPAVAFGKGLFVDGGCNTSADGLTWDPPTNSCSLKALDFGNGVFLAITGAQQVLRSADGRTWTPLGAIPAGPDLYHVRFVRFP